MPEPSSSPPQSSKENVPRQPRLRATYRLQFNEHFRLADALALVPYFHDLGVSHLYAAPLFTARAHSVHGYDVCDFHRLNPEVGTEDDLAALVAALHQRGMGLVLDIVPNHMGVGTRENHWWWNVLKHGDRGEFAGHFDVDWNSPDPTRRGKILVPVLGDDLPKILERGELTARIENGETVLRYFEHEFPVAPGSLPDDVTMDRSFSDSRALAQLIDRQHYRLACWRDGDRWLNYRRFFAVSTLAAVRVEDPKVFADVHELLRQWIVRGWLDGLRVDHPDGLRDPKKYLDRLRSLAPGLWIIVEKILQPEEHLPADWAADGTVGYDFLNQVNGLFLDPAGENAFTAFYHEFTGDPADTGSLVREKKRLVLQTLFVTEVNRLVGLLQQIVSEDAGNVYTPEQFREALVEFAAAFPVYRTYVRPEDHFVGESDLQYILTAAEIARKQRPDVSPALFHFLSGLLQLHFRGELENEFVCRFQQLTGPAMAKGVEDTVFFCLNRFASVNEVGADPGKFGVSPAEFHDFCRRHARRPHSMLCSSTHDTKRSEDVRARMNVLSEIPAEWFAAVRRWSKLNERHRQNNFPDRNLEYLFYQTLVGAWPLSLERLLAYLDKAACEAKQHTDWNDRNAAYDDALRHFVTAALADQPFVADLEKFLAALAEPAQVNSLAQTLVKLTAPGVPDLYQGNELWDFSLVDPDNRRFVDFSLRRRRLAEARNLSAEQAWARRDEGMPKLWLTQKVLQLRADRNDLFAGDYQPHVAAGPKADHLFAFIRGGALLTAVPRFTRKLNHDWQGTTLPLPDGRWRNEFTGETASTEIAADALFRKFPVALLIPEE